MSTNADANAKAIAMANANRANAYVASTASDGAPRSSALRERLAPREHAEARAIYAKGGVPALVAFAHERLEVVAARRRDLEDVMKQVETTDPNANAKTRAKAREEILAAYLRRSATDRKTAKLLSGDLKALRKRREGLMDLAALGERALRRESEEELRAEVALAIAVDSDSVAWVEVDFGKLVHLAKTPGRWSRRTEAGALLVKIARSEQGRRHYERFTHCALALSARTEHRWVQPVGFALLAACDSARARALFLERFHSPSGDDDFLVRERLVELVGHALFGDPDELLVTAASDPSDHVRLAAVRAEHDTQRLTTLLRDDASPKVRAATAISLARRIGGKVEGILCTHLEAEETAFVVLTTAEELTKLVRRGRADGPTKILAAIGHAAERTDLPAATLLRLAELTSEVAVLSSPLLRPVHDLFRDILSKTPVPGRTRLVGPALAAMDDEDLGRILAVIAASDFGVGLDREGPTEATLYRGEPRTFAWWRALFEMAHPAPSKRQAFTHTWSRQPLGALRAPPAGLAELTATNVPGERVLVERVGGWGRHLPLVDDLLALRPFGHQKSTLVSALGTTTLTARSSFMGRVSAWFTLTRNYAELVELRRRALASDEAPTRAAFVAEVERRTGIRIRFAPHVYAAGKTKITLPSPDDIPPQAPQDGALVAGAPSAPIGFAALAFLPNKLGDEARALIERVPGLSEEWQKLALYAGSPRGNRLPHLAAYALVMLAGMMVRSVVTRRGIDRDRASIPLVIGGWGTRGKSGTERLKAGLFQGLGHETVVKTTGCEAMFIHAMPGIPAREIFLYRPYDKATVWEQRNVLGLGAKFGSPVFLYECMALQPDLVGLLQSQWMRDDYSTITNAYPDHEDVQGPTGFDVATCISEFVPTKGRLFTTEDQMLPLLRERAKERGTELREVPARDADLVADDLLARFPYQEHPKNIALVTALARTLGVPWSIAIAEMADNVVPDLGVLKTYPDVPYAGRMLTFTNGMSANERTGAMANWRRTEFDLHDPERDPARWIVTVVNNRADRIARSEVFARFIVEDIAAHVHVLIGTNVGGLVGFIDQALERHLAAINPTADLEGDPATQQTTARTRIDRAFAALKIARVDGESARREMASLGLGKLDPPLVDALVEPASERETHEAARAAIDAAIPPWIDAETKPFVTRALARRRTARAIHLALERHLATDPKLVNQLFASAYREMFKQSVVPLTDSSLSGDQVVDRVARSVPPGARASIQGVQNIKGTGLDFVYRWVSLGIVQKFIHQLGSNERTHREEGLRSLLLHDDFGLVDADYALAEVERTRATDREAGEMPYDAVIGRLRGIVETRRAKLTAQTETGLSRAKNAVKQFIGITFDYLDSIRRQGMARELTGELLAGRVSHATAALRMREIVARSKGGWMKK